ARKAFSAVVDNYPASAKVPDALLKLGYIEIEQKNPAKARDYLTKVTVAYPSSTAAHLAAKKLLLIDPPKNEPSR
ncbi:MAG: tetratricopeptide repeat protein, partial [Methylobacter sp.]|nr:tetratricopeptide repeat protein [Methylobacter sp.]